MKFETIAQKHRRSVALIEAAELSFLLRETYGLPIDHGKAGYRVTVNGYDEFRKLEITFDGEVVHEITQPSEVPAFINSISQK